MERTFYPGSEGEQTDNGIRIRRFYGMKKSKDAKYGESGTITLTYKKPRMVIIIINVILLNLSNSVMVSY